MIGLSHIALAGALAACLAGGTGYLHGMNVGEAREQAAQAREDKAIAAATRKLQGQLDAAGEQHAAAETARQGQVREIVRESKTIVERPVYRNVCVDADGVRLLDRAAAVANGAQLQPAPAGSPGPAAEGGAQP
jgi:hypothetical protein